MRILRICIIILAWIGIIFLVRGLWGIANMTIDDLTYTPSQIRGPMISGWNYFFMGVILSAICGLIGRPRYFWPILVTLGTICSILVIIDAIAEQAYFQNPISRNLSFRLPFGIVCIAIGLIIRWLRGRKITIDNPSINTQREV